MRAAAARSRLASPALAACALAVLAGVAAMAAPAALAGGTIGAAGGQAGILRGGPYDGYFVPAVSYGGEAGGVSADAGTIVLGRSTGFPPRGTTFGLLDTADGRLERVHLRGQYLLNAVSPHGARVYLVHYLIVHGGRVPAGHGTDDLELRVLDRRGGSLEPRPVPVGGDGDGRLSGIAVSTAADRDGRWAYTLFYGDRRELYLLALDTIRGRAVRVDLPRPRQPAQSYSLRLRRSDGGRELEVLSPTTFARRPLNLAAANPLLRIDTATLRVSGRLAAGRSWPEDELRAFASEPRHRFAMARFGIAGYSAEGRPIRIRELGEAALRGELLVFGCIHGDECAAQDLRPTIGGCPPPGADVFVVRNLDPDGTAAGTRLNGRGVDLNRNFGGGWRRAGERGDPEYPGPQPFSEPETRLAARIVRTLEPRVTIWFHQHHGRRPFVRAWGQSAPAARQFAHVARMPFKLLPWPAGTGPNWQNHRFPGSASFVVELPPGEIGAAMSARLSKAIVQLGRRVSED